MIKSKPEVRGKIKNSQEELPARKRRWEHWLLVEEGLTSTPALDLYPVVSCQGSSGSNGLKGKTNTFWSHGGFRGLWLHLCHSAMNCSECPDGYHPPAACLCRLRLSPAHPLSLHQQKQLLWAVCGKRGGRVCLPCSKIVLWKDKLTLMTFKN